MIVTVDTKHSTQSLASNGPRMKSVDADKNADPLGESEGFPSERSCLMGLIPMHTNFRSLLTIALLGCATVAFGQRQGNTGTSPLGGGLGGASSLGGSSFGSAASSALGGSSLGGSNSIGGSSIGGGGQAGTGGFAGPRFNDASGNLGNTINNGFIGRSDNTDRLIGSQNAGQQATGTPQNFGALGNRGGGSNNGGTTVVRPIRPQHRVSFAYPSRPAPEVQANVIQHLARITVAGFTDVTLQVDGDGTAILLGTVDDEHQRKLVEAFVRLEPGVRSIVNELAVPPSDASTP